MKRTIFVPVLLLCLCSCTSESITNVEKDFVIAGRKAHGVEVARQSSTGRRLVQREMRLLDETGAPGDVVKLLAEIEKDGDVRGASLRWEGVRGRRYVELRTNAAGLKELASRGNDEVIALPAGRVRVLELADVQQGLFDVELELAHASVRGTHALTHEVRAEHKAATPFIESTAPKVQNWCKQQSAERDALAAARQLALAVRPKLGPDRGGGPPSALSTVDGGGSDEGGAALLVACLRAIGHPARVVSGSVEGGPEPRTWAQVWDGARFIDVDPLDVSAAHAARHAGFRDSYFSLDK